MYLYITTSNISSMYYLNIIHNNIYIMFYTLYVQKIKSTWYNFKIFL